MCETESNQSINLIYIVGVGRSGTSLLQSMFAAHPEVSCLPETSFLRRFVANGVLQSVFKSHGLAAAISKLKTDSFFGRTQLSATKLINEKYQSAGQLDLHVYKGMLRAVKNDFAGSVVDKDPRSIEFLPLLKVAFPDAQVINIIRDPRDVLASKKQAAWSRSGHIWKHIFANSMQLKLGRACGKELFGERYHEVIYEDLISSPEGVLSTLCEKSGIGFDQKMLCFAEAAKMLVSDSELSWKRETLGPLLKDNKGKWREMLEPREARLTELCCDEALRIGQYIVNRRSTKLGLTDRAWVRMGQILISLYEHPYSVYRKHKLKRACRRIS